MIGPSPAEYAQELTRFLANAGYPPAFVEVARDRAVSVWYWVGATTIQISRDLLSDMRQLATEIAFEAHRRGVVTTRL
jgi:hypothetical protein